MTKEKKSLWQRIKSFTTGTEPMEPEFQEFVEHIDEVEDVQPETEPELSPEEISSRAIRLAGEEEEKARLAELAREQAERAEAASRCARIDAALLRLNEDAVRLQEESALSQQEASKALSLLAEAESAAAAAQGEYESARDEEASVLKAGEEKIASLMEEWETRLKAMSENTALLEQEVQACRVSVEEAANDLKDKEIRLEDAEAEQRRLAGESAEQMNRAAAASRECKDALELAGKRMALLESRIAKEQYEFEQAEGALSAAAASVVQAEEAVLLVKEEMAELEREQAAAVSKQKNENNGIINALEEANLALVKKVDELRVKAEEAERLAAAAEGRLTLCEETVRTLKLDRENTKYTAKSEMQKVNDAIDAAKQAVVENKEAYAAAQRSSEEVTARATQANAVAKRARAQAEKAALETNDARTAEDTARKLKTDAVAAKGADETASLLLGKAEMVLDAAIEKAAKLVEEKEMVQHELEEKADQLCKEADEINAEAARISSDVEDKISRWLDSEEELVRATAHAEEDKQALESGLAAELTRIDEEIRKGEQDSAVAREEKIRASAGVKEAVALVKQSEEELHAAGDRLAAGIASCDAVLCDLEQAQREEMNRMEEKRAAAEHHQQAAEQTYARLNVAQEERNRAFSVALEEYGKERDSLREEQAARENELDQAERSAAALEKSYKDALSYLRERIDECRTSLAAARKQDAEERELLNKKEQVFAAAKSELAENSSRYAAVLEQTKEEAKAALEPKSQRAASLRALAEAAANALPIRRSEAEEAVRAASERFDARLAALNAVAQKKTEKEIAVMQENSIDLYQQADAAAEELKQVEQAYSEASDLAEQLRLEEENISVTALDNSKRIEEEASVKVADLDQRLADLTAKVNEEESAVTMGEEAIVKAESVAREAEDFLTLAEQEKEELFHRAAAEKERLQQEYDANIRKAEEALSAETERLTQAELEVSARNAEEETAHNAFEAQDRLAGSLRLAEADAPVQGLERITALKNSHRSVVDCIRRDLAAREKEQEKIRVAYASSEAKAIQAEREAVEAKAAADRMAQEIAAVKDKADSELAAVTARVTELREDAAEKESRFREYEKTLSNSSQLLEAAEEKVRAAQLISAKSLAELQAALAAQETATSLARQAAGTFERMDPATAEIMRRASEDLFSAAENAAVLVEEKEAAHRETEQALEQVRSELDQLKAEIGSAPEQMEQARTVWQAAEQAYRTYRVEADVKTAEIREDLDRHLPTRMEEAAAANDQAALAAKEAEAAREAVHQLDVKLSQITAALESAAAELEQAEAAEKEAVGKAESDAAQDLSEKQRARELGDLQLESCRLALQQASEAAVLARKDADSIRAQHQQAVTEHEARVYGLSREYQNELALWEQRENDALRHAEDAAASVEEAKAQLAAAKQSFEQHSAALQSLRKESAAAEADKRMLGIRKDRQLRGEEEEKLRLLGSCTIRRLRAEEEVSRIAGELAQKRNQWSRAAKRTADVEAAMAQLRQKLDQLMEEAVGRGWAVLPQEPEDEVINSEEVEA